MTIYMSYIFCELSDDVSFFFKLNLKYHLFCRNIDEKRVTIIA